ncbi:MAG TPA: DNA replication and repair protein RecF [Flavobacteriales bacterium]|nr:DNA replication and repair protein RecF [Flavobacteriales bacterium]
MRLEHLHLVHFKNHSGADVSLGPQVNCFLGDNGSGKTNVLDAVHYLCFCKSYFNPIDAQNIAHGEPFMLIQGDFDRLDTKERVSCGVQRGAKKQFKRNDKPYKRLAEHIGRFPAVMIAPDDAELIQGGSEMRRKWMDAVISQYDRSYLEALIDVNKALVQRNALLRYFAENRTFDAGLLAPWNARIAPNAAVIAKARRSFVDSFLPGFLATYEEISGGAEQVGLTLTTHVSEDAETIEAKMLAAQDEDRRLRRTTVGVHKDDVVFTLGDHALKRFGSQGQQKSFLVAMRLAQLSFIEEATGVKPILLLDDIFDKIDEKRVEALMKRVTNGTFGQVFITDTHLGRIPDMFAVTGADVQVFQVQQGEVIPQIADA